LFRYRQRIIDFNAEVRDRAFYLQDQASFLKRTPAPPPFSSMNSIPARSSTRRDAWLVSQLLALPLMPISKAMQTLADR